MKLIIDGKKNENDYWKVIIHHFVRLAVQYHNAEVIIK